MKTKFLFASLVASAVMVGCSNEELPVAQDASSDNLALIFDGIEGVESRMAYDGTNGSFLWAIGDKIGVSRTSGKSVTTNYVFKAEAVTDDNTKDLSAWATTGSNKYAYFETEFGSIFKGNYVVYYPYDENFCEDGKITAKLKVGQVEDASNTFDHVAKDGFMMSAPVAFEGGQSAEKFVLYPVFGRLAINVKSSVSGCEVQTIVVRSLNGATLPTAMEIDADVNVVNGLLNPAAMHVVESSKVEEIVLAVDGAADVTDTDGYTAYLTLVPGNYSNIAIDVVTNKGTYTKTFANAPVGTGTKTDIALTFGANELQNLRTYYVASEASWASTITKIAGMTYTETSPATIKVVNDVEMDGANFRAGVIPAMVPLTIVGDGSLTMTTNVNGDNSLGAAKFEVPVTVKGQLNSAVFENVCFNKGLNASLYVYHASSYEINGGEVGTATIAKDGAVVTANNVVFKNTVNITETGDIDTNTGKTDVNFNNCTFKGNLTNTAGDITINAATMNHAKESDPALILSVAGGNVYMKGANSIDAVSATGVLNILNGATATIDHSLTTPQTGSSVTVNVNKEAVLTLGSGVDYVLNKELEVEGKLVNNGTLTAIAAAVIDDMTQNNHKGILENNGTVRVNTAAYEGVWYNNQNITFVNSANYNVVLSASNSTLDQANFKKYVAKEDVTGIELNSNATAAPILLQGRGTAASGAYVIDFSDKNLILNANSADITARIVDGLKFKNITVKGAGEVLLEVSDATKNASFTTGNLTIAGELTLAKGANANAGNVKANVTNATVATNATLHNGAQVTYTGTFTNKGTVSGGNPVK
ncbi:MAG: hypothetical protein E7096_09055 [Bacteroides sp.]|nr:hypothetical protein [Bacteroides sp.]